MAYNATRVAYDGQPARVTILDYALAALLVEDTRAYASWPPALQARLTSKMQSTRGENATEREELGHTVALDATTGGPREVCLYHRSCAAPRRRARKGAARKPSSLRRMACGTCESTSSPVAITTLS